MEAVVRILMTLCGHLQQSAFFMKLVKQSVILDAVGDVQLTS